MSQQPLSWWQCGGIIPSCGSEADVCGRGWRGGGAGGRGQLSAHAWSQPIRRFGEYEGSWAKWARAQRDQRRNTCSALEDHGRSTLSPPSGGTPKFNFERPGTVSWASLEMKIRDHDQSLLLIKANKAGKIVRTTRHFDKVFGKSLGPADGKEHNFWQALIDRSGATDPIAWRDLANHVSRKCRHRIEKIVLGGEFAKVAEFVEAQPIEDHKNITSLYLITIAFERGPTGTECLKASDEIVAWWRKKNGFARNDARFSHVSSGGFETLKVKAEAHMENCLRWNDSMNERRHHSVTNDPTQSVNYKTSGFDNLVRSVRSGPCEIRESAQKEKGLDANGNVKFQDRAGLGLTDDERLMGRGGLGAARLFEKATRSRALQQEADFFQHPDPHALSDMTGVRQTIHRTLIDNTTFH